ncbi:MAG TPA: glycosyltransferase, partial [Anaerolineales bacterium]|nr:glycosyltransferase [Anaerolineales bacterium]
ALFLPHLRGGGAEKMVAALANGLSARGYRVDMVLVRAAGVHLQELSAEVQVIDLAARNSYLALPRLMKYLRRQQPQVLVSSLPLTNLIAIIAHRLARSRSRLAIRIENTTSAQRRAPWKKMLEKSLLSWLYPSADMIIAVSRAVAKDAERYLGLHASRIDVIYNPVLEPVPDAAGASRPAHPWYRDGCPPVVLAVGRLTPAKDFPTLIRAFSEVRRQRFARLVVLGEGEERLNLLALARELGVANDTDLPGFVSDVRSFMRHSAVFVLSSLYEGLPTVLIEALASGCAVVSTDCPGGSREILADGAYGDLVPVGDAHAMASPILRNLGGERKYVELAWLQQFRLDTVLDQTVEALQLPPPPA